MGKKNDTSKTAPASAETPAPKKKTSKPAPAATANAIVPAPVTAAEPAAPATNGAATTKAKKKPAAPKAAAPKKTAKAAAPTLEAATITITFTTEDIALRAYYIAEDRQRQGIHGDSHSDWIEAERQLHAEHGTRKKPARKKA